MKLTAEPWSFNQFWTLALKSQKGNVSSAALVLAG